MALSEGNMKKIYLILCITGLILSSCASKSENQTGSNYTIKKSTNAKTNSSSDALVGNALDEQDRKIMEKTSPRTVDRMDRKEPLTINDIIKLSQGGVSDDTIIRYIQENRTTYNLSQAQINRLQEAGVSQRVINYMIETGK